MINWEELRRKQRPNHTDRWLANEITDKEIVDILNIGHMKDPIETLVKTLLSTGYITKDKAEKIRSTHVFTLFTNNGVHKK